MAKRSVVIIISCNVKFIAILVMVARNWNEIICLAYYINTSYTKIMVLFRYCAFSVVIYRGLEREVQSLADRLEELSAAIMSVQVCDIV